MILKKEWVSAGTYTPTCAAPEALAVVAGNTSATISWTEGAGTQQLRYKQTSDDTWTEVLEATSPYELSGLTNGTEYEVQARSLCREDIFTDWSASVNFSPSVPTGMDNIGVDTKAVLRLENGHIVIIRDGKTYTIQGQQLISGKRL